MKTIAVLLLALSLRPLPAQIDASLIGTGYSAPAPVELAPGQVVTLFFRGVKPLASGAPRSGQAQSVPLPLALAGLSVRVWQPPQTNPYPAPILAVRQHNDCEEVTGRPVCLLTAVRIQVPSELTPTISKLVLEEDGQASRTFLVRPIRDNSHIITTCDLTWDTNPGSDCGRLAFHANGEVVDGKAPAKLGETIVFYAHGLGPTTPRIAAGAVSPPGAAVIDAVSRNIAVRFDFLVNADPALPRYTGAETGNSGSPAAFVGLTPSQVGLYQINVAIPRSLEIPVRCGGDIRSNVLAKVATSQGIENVPLCVEP